MRLSPGTRLGSYEIVSAIGAGGMGEVYRARDTNLGRDVAIKVLPEAFAQDADRLARFEREAKTLASLNHANIAIVHGLETAGDLRALVMELVAGPTLADRIMQGPIASTEALRIARQIAAALEAAHEQGIVHRDLKPANVKVRSDATVRVLDFGLAKVVKPGAPARPDMAESPTITSSAQTQHGVILGTAAYMSPEQALGKMVDKRTDIWAFGCVLYEMLTGRRAFDEDSVTETVAAVLHKEPDWSKLPTRTSPAIRRLLRRSLCKDPARRLRDIGDAAQEIDDAGDPQPDTVESPSVRSWHWRLATLILAGVVVAGAINVWRTWPSRSTTVSKLILGSRSGEELANRPTLSFTVAADGSGFVYVGPDGRLWIREFGQLEARALAGTEKASTPFFSPDGRSVAFVTLDGALKVSPIRSGSVQTVVADSVNVFGGGDWTPEGVLYFSRTAGGVDRVAATGGSVEPVSRPEAVGVTHRWVDVLPGGKAALMSIVNESVNTAQIGVLRLDTGNVQPLFPGAMARFTSTGHVLYVTSDGTLHAVRFDPERLRAIGRGVPLIENIDVELYASCAKFALSEGGTLLYLVPLRQDSELVWVTKRGVATPLTPEPWVARFFSLSLSPDGKRLAATVHVGTRQDVWIRSLETSALNRVTFERDGTLNYRPKWTADGQTLTYISNRSGKAGELWRHAADGSAPAERLATDGPIIDEGAISPDGLWAVYRAGGSDLQSRDIKVLRIGPGADAVPKALVATKAEEYSPAVSPDGRWLAYVSQESGRAEVYVRPFPEAQRALWQISSGGGVGPVWARDGRHLFFVNQRRELMEVTTRGTAAFEWGPVRVLFDVSGYEMNNWHPTYDVSPVGERFLMVRPSERTRHDLVVIFNWFDELKGKLQGQ